MTYKKIGTGSGDVADGAHLHSTYATTTHAATHDRGGPDVITALGPLTLYGEPTKPAGPPDDSHLTFYSRFISFRPVLAVQSLDREMQLGSEIQGPSNIWRVQANTGSTAPPSGSIPHATTGTFSVPTPTTSIGFVQQIATTTTANSTASISTTDTRWTRGDNVLPWCGFCFHARIGFPSAAYSNSNFYCGMTDQSIATALNTSNPAGHRLGFKIIGGSGNFLMTNKDGTTEHTLDSGIALVQNHIYEFYVFMRPNGSYCFGQIDDLTAGTSTNSMIDVAGQPPGTTTFMRAVAGIQTTNTTAKAIYFGMIGCEVPV